MTVFDSVHFSLENIAQWSKSFKILMAGLPGILMFLIGYALIMTTDLEQYAALRTQEMALKINLEHKYWQARQVPHYRVQVQTLNQQLDKLLTPWPGKNAMASLVNDISKTGISAGLTFELLAPQSSVVNDWYAELPVNLIALGNYSQVARFLSHLVEMKQGITLHDFELLPVPGSIDTLSAGEILKMKMTVKMYCLSDRTRSLPFLTTRDSKVPRHDLYNYIQEIKVPERIRMAALPDFEPVVQFVYPQQGMQRSPFQAGGTGRQVLEQYSPTVLKFVGTVRQGKTIWGLIKQPDGSIVTVRAGDPVGNRFGKVIGIDEQHLELEEGLPGKQEPGLTIINLNTAGRGA